MGGVDRDSAAAVRHILPHHAAALRHIDGLHKIEVRKVLDFTVRVAWRQFDVCDDRVVRIVGVELAEGASVSYWPAAPDDAPLKAGENLLVDDDFLNVSANRLSPDQN